LELLIQLHWVLVVLEVLVMQMEVREVILFFLLSHLVAAVLAPEKYPLASQLEKAVQAVAVEVPALVLMPPVVLEQPIKDILAQPVLTILILTVAVAVLAVLVLLLLLLPPLRGRVAQEFIPT